MDIVLMLLGFVLLVVGGDFLVRASVALSFKLNISKMVVGLTVVSFATSFPELLVSLNAALNGSPSIAINNVIGSNIANIGLVLGITALIGTIFVDSSFYKFNWPALMLFSLAFYYFLSNDRQLTAFEGAILFIGLIIFVILLLKKSNATDGDHDESLELQTGTSNFKIVIWFIIGGVALYFGADWLVNGAIVIAKQIGVSEAVISVSIIAVGTSVPELAASVIAVIRKEKAISLGNLIGSNIFNIGSVLGLTAMIKPIVIDDAQILSRDIIWMLVFAAILVPLALILKRHELKKTEGFVLIFMYGIFIYLAFIS
ncbi:calcium/sodium antiporter [Flavobacteriaceae bacterium]|nr:calcium/sodium antiporter [Flavobacteriaceae bacterium]MDB4107983.1 calcium/sodium antiporter [Flavobacteriaceae bacterium]MDB4182936.1 calcium/sodium antiporter [Flavobacteriaceae bacterium]MDB4206412.1 calcium/sodium antiporter [Flavobacteriaceae bacterium]